MYDKMYQSNDQLSMLNIDTIQSIDSVPDNIERGYTLRPKTYKLLNDCIEAGVEMGLNRAYKHDSNPPNYYIKEKIQQAIMEVMEENFDL